MKLTQAWEKEWHEIEVPEAKVLAAIDAGLGSQNKPPRFKWSSKKIIAVAASLVLIGTGAYVFRQAGQPSTSVSTLEHEVAKTDDARSSLAPETVMRGDKIAKTYWLTKETNQLDQSVSQIETELANVSGYISYSQIEQQTSQHQGRYANLTVRVPIEKITTFLDKIEKIGVTTHSEVSSEDLTLTYVDNASRIAALEKEETALLDLMGDQAEVADLIAIQERLAIVRGEKESLVASNKIIDNHSEEATLNLFIQEVSQFTQEGNALSIGDKIKRNFQNQAAFWRLAWKEIVVFIVSYLVYILLLVGGTGAGIWWYQHRKNKQV